MVKLIVGLGNPGRLYKNCRHNIGMRVVGNLAKKYKIKLKRDKSALYKEGRGRIDETDFILAYPLVYMNLSGESIYSLFKKHRIRLENLLVIYDDLDLDLGNIRIRSRGSSAGHKGIRSIIEYLKSDSFARLRLGIGRPHSKIDIKDFVLSEFKPEESDLIAEAIQKAIRCCNVWLLKGINKAMNQFN